jgi:hypothetical protein
MTGQTTTAGEQPETLQNLAMETLREVMRDKGAPAAARAAAARTILETLGVIGRNSQALQDLEVKDLSLMSQAELDAEIRRLSKR